MTTDPRAALDRLIAALQAHLTAAEQRRGDDDPTVAAAYDTLADAFDTYDDALFQAHHETTPFDLFDEDEEDDEEEDEEDEEDGDDLDLTGNDFDDHVDDDLEESLNPPRN